MCKGYFEDTRPKINSFLFIPHSEIRGQVKFLLDTGADITSITINDAQALGIDTEKITNSSGNIKIDGAGGATEAHVLENTIGFVFYDFYPQIKKTSYHIEYLRRILLVPRLFTSLLGRDLLSRFDIEISTVPERINLKRNDFAGECHICYSVKTM